VFSARSAYDASQVGLEVGTRTVLDVLLNQQTLFNAEREYALARYSSDSTIDIDLDQWASANNANPVYYVQYVAARTASILRNADPFGLVPDAGTVGLLTPDKEGAALRGPAGFPRGVAPGPPTPDSDDASAAASVGWWASGVGLAGTVTYILVDYVADDTSGMETGRAPLIVPVVGPGFQGVTVQGAF